MASRFWGSLYLAGGNLFGSFNLEDGAEELERQLSAACAFHNIGPDDCGDRLHLDSGLVQPLCTAIEDRDGFALAEGVFVQLAATIRDGELPR